MLMEPLEVVEMEDLVLEEVVLEAPQSEEEAVAKVVMVL